MHNTHMATIEETMDILHIEKKGPLLNTWEHFHIHSLSTQKLQMNDKYTDIHNPKFDLIIKTYPTQQKTTHQHISPTTT
jgi:hypothetical protein